MCFCKREAVKDIWKIDEQPDVSTISSDFQLGKKQNKTIYHKFILMFSYI